LDDDEAEEETEELTNQVNFQLPFIEYLFWKNIMLLCYVYTTFLLDQFFK
jgi:hypothetical protein